VTAPHALFDNSAGQLNAYAIGTLLAERYPETGERRVAIGLTRSDMYIPGFGWSYAFSYRYGDRFAVVSSARMSHGCLDIVQADEARQLTRLRKMVGKNIGILHYGLPLSSDPRSLRYANVGGPQELDVMAETF
jgi:predicted Zn-dependent protease